LPDNLFESELFGHERGAFTGASTAKSGLVEAASGGTLFLDEVGDIPLAMQVKLLRLLETGTYRRVGSTEIRRTDIRVISATHRDLEQMIQAGSFREDLYYRLSTFPIHLPALHERRDDIALLVEALLARVAPRRKLQISEAALQLLEAQDYPGNVRELRNLLERSALLCDGDTLVLSHVQQAVASGRRPSIALRAQLPAALVDREGALNSLAPVPGALKTIARAALQQLLKEHQGSRAELAHKLGISERSLYRKLKAQD
jgi:DNA-binding NtrC family response regulator